MPRGKWQTIPVTLNRALEVARLSPPSANLFAFYDPASLTEVVVAIGTSRMVAQEYFPDDTYPSKTAIADYDPRRGLEATAPNLLRTAAELVRDLQNNPDPIVHQVLKSAEARRA